jgi:hypothetical protein
MYTGACSFFIESYHLHLIFSQISIFSVPEEGQEQGQGQPSSSYNRGQKIPPKQPLRVLPTGLQVSIYLYIWIYFFICMYIYPYM